MITFLQFLTINYLSDLHFFFVYRRFHIVTG
uniref:Uncharacterized protein n=1 Tax=Rhizophora mucronata TaxID=61149 RepID=A0A2P2QDI0_RHIMU